jgi:NADPH:quinone reductase
MRAATFSQTGPAREVLHLGDVALPDLRPGEVRVRIATSGVNPSDVKRRGAEPHGSPAEFPLVIPHSDGAGTIDAVGPAVRKERIGDRVWLWNAQFKRAFGTAAEYCTLPSEQAVRLPDDIDFAIGACLGVPAQTAYHAIMLDGTVRGQTLLVQGGAGAVAHYAIQFAKADGATVIATVSSEAKSQHAEAAGADFTINYKTEDVKARIGALTSGRGVDRVIEVDLSANAMTYPAILRDYAKVVVYGMGGIASVPSLIRKGTTIQFFVVYDLSPEQRKKTIGAITGMLEAGTLQHAIAACFPLDRIVEAHETVERGTAMGNVILEL